MEHADILHRCFRCGYCKLPSDYTNINCPAYLKFRFETYSPGGRMWLLNAWLHQDIEASPRLAEILFSCAACGNCVEHCAFPTFKDELLEAFISGRTALIEAGKTPPPARDVFQSMMLYGNPYKLPEDQRARWADGLDLKPYSGQDYLFFVGSAGSFDERGVRMARTAAQLLDRLGVSFGILGEREVSDGNEIRAMGERGLFEHLAGQNIQNFEDLGVGKVLALSPHAFHAFKNDYPALGGRFEVRHYTQVLSEVLAGAELPNRPEPLRVTLHDPCYLGRHNGEYQAPRRILSRLPGVELVEMDRVRENALCCGGGGGNFFTDILGQGVDSPARVRVREAAETGAEVLAVACPKCAKMLDDAVKAENLEHRLRVLDLAEIVTEALEGSFSQGH